MTTENEPIYLKKSILFFKIYSILFLFSIIMSSIGKLLLGNHYGLLDLLIGLPSLAALIMVPIGMYYNWKSKKRNEENPKIRFKYFLRHSFFCLIVILMFSILIKDLAQLF